jgi:hypothetical protein
MRKLLAAALCMIALPALAEDWHVGPAPSDDPEMTAATIRNEEGAVLYLWSLHSSKLYQVFAEFHLPPGQSFGTEMPVYSIDGGAAIDTEAIRREGDDVGTVWGYLGDTATLWLVWTSIQDTVLPSDRLHDWFTGRELTIDYVDSAGARRSARFDLAGSQPAILAATDLKSE